METDASNSIWQASTLETRTEQTPIPPPPETKNVRFDMNENDTEADNIEKELMDTEETGTMTVAQTTTMTVAQAMTVAKFHGPKDLRQKHREDKGCQDTPLKCVAIAGPSQNTFDDKTYEERLRSAEETESQMAEQILQSENGNDQLKLRNIYLENLLGRCQTQMESDRQKLESVQKCNEEMMAAINTMRSEYKKNKANYEKDKVNHARERANCENKVIALRECVRVASNTPPDSSTPTPQAPLCSRFIRSDGASIGVVPLWPPVTPSNPPNPPTNPDTSSSTPGNPPRNAGTDNTNHSPQTLQEIIKETLRQLKGNEVLVSKSSSRRPLSARTRHRKVLKAEKTKISKAQDLAWKDQVRTAWKKHFKMTSVADFAHYNPVPKQAVKEFETGPNGPDGSNTLDFNRGFEKSRWNKVIMGCFYDQILVDCERDSTWNVLDVSKDYIISLFYGQLKCSQEAWALVQQCPNLEDWCMETHNDVTTCVANYTEDCIRVVSSRSHREQKYQHRVKTVECIIILKTESDAPDLEAWKFFRQLLIKLSTNGMSSEEEGVKKIGDFIIPVFCVKICPRRNLSLTDYFNYVDKESQSLAICGKQGLQLQPHVYTEEIGSGKAPKELARLLYNPSWLSHKEDIQGAKWAEQELRVSQDVFEMLKFTATL